MITPKFFDFCGRPHAPGTGFCENGNHVVEGASAHASFSLIAAVSTPLAPQAGVGVGNGITGVLLGTALLVLGGLGFSVALADDSTTPAAALQAVAPAPSAPPPPADSVEDSTLVAQRWVDSGYVKEQAGNLQAALADYQQALQLTGDRKLATHIEQLRKTARSEAALASVRITPAMVKAATIIHATGNDAAVANGATRANTFVIAEPMLITSIKTYHWNNGKGKTPGRISLDHEDGTKYGEWQAQGTDGQGGVPNANWSVVPGVVLKPGKYTLLDSHPTSWSQNAASGGRGMCEIKGLPWRPASIPP